MTYKIESSITKEMIESGIIDFYLGEFLVWNMPASLLPMNNVILQNYISEKYPKITTKEINYQIGKMQSHRGNEVLIERFGYTPNEKLMKESFGKSEFLGVGKFDFLDFNTKEKSFTVINVTSPYANQYLKVLGKQKEAQCHHLRGLCAGSFQPFFEKDEMLCIETSCIAKGDSACIFKIKPEKNWDKKDKTISNQLIKNKFPKEIFEKYYNRHALVSRNSDKPKNQEEEEEEEKSRIQKIIEEHKRNL